MKYVLRNSAFNDDKYPRLIRHLEQLHSVAAFVIYFDKLRVTAPLNSVMDTIRQILAEGDEVRIGSLGRFTVISDISGNKTPAFVSGKAFRMAVSAGEGIV
jgi:nucleoid DNA-binding protein